MGLPTEQGMLDTAEHLEPLRVPEWRRKSPQWALKGDQSSINCGAEGDGTGRETQWGAIAEIANWEMLGAQIQMMISRVKRKGQIQEPPRRLVNLVWKRNRFEGNQELCLRFSESEIWAKQSSGSTWWAPGNPGPGTANTWKASSHFLDPHLWHSSLIKPNAQTPRSQLQIAPINQLQLTCKIKCFCYPHPRSSRGSLQTEPLSDSQNKREVGNEGVDVGSVSLLN